MTVVILVVSIVWYALIEMVCLSIVSSGEIQARVNVRVFFFIPSLPNILCLMDKKRQGIDHVIQKEELY